MHFISVIYQRLEKGRKIGAFFKQHPRFASGSLSNKTPIRAVSSAVGSDFLSLLTSSEMATMTTTLPFQDPQPIRSLGMGLSVRLQRGVVCV